MSGFVSAIPGRAGSVICRSLSCGWVWAMRPLPSGGIRAGFSPAPACLFIPFSSRSRASAFARGVASVGWRSWVRSGGAGSGVWSASSLPVPDFAVKVALPSGWSAHSGIVVLSNLLLPICL